ncbi:MAG: UDP-N-acetylmuramoyl-tripeptide--D-alanyl-D-alanine ligase [Thermoanaerobaculia bacterium]
MAMEGEVISGHPKAVWRGAVLDSRAITGGELFFALPGERTDGHQFVDQALERGAAAAVIHQVVAIHQGQTAIRVADTYAALHRLTESVRQRVPRRLVAVTGSVGKTTIKELLAAMLGRRFKVARNPGNLNNLLGFPIALLGIPEDTEWMVAEMGMSTAGELARISRLGRPDAALLANVRPVHLESFGTLREVAEAKAELLEGLSPEGLLVANRDDPEVARVARRHPGRIVWYGLRKAADYTVSGVEAVAGGLATRFVLEAPGEACAVDLPLHGLYNVENCLAAASCAHALGVPLEEIAAAAAAVEAPAMRGIVYRLPGDRVVIDDSYNSNPAALEAALESARQLPARRRWAVLGDMLELGEQAPRFHREAGRAAARLGFSPVVGVGELARSLVESAEAAGSEGRWYASAEEAATGLAGGISAGDLVLVKGSRGMALERVVRVLTTPLGEAG